MSGNQQTRDRSDFEKGTSTNSLNGRSERIRVENGDRRESLVGHGREEIDDPTSEIIERVCEAKNERRVV